MMIYEAEAAIICVAWLVLWPREMWRAWRRYQRIRFRLFGGR